MEIVSLEALYDMVKIDIPPHGAAFRYMVHRKKGKDDAYAAACVYIVVVCACVGQIFRSGHAREL